MPLGVTAMTISREVLIREAKIKWELAQRKAERPMSFFRPNLGQRRLLDILENHKPLVAGFLAGNGVGKTCLMAQVMAGLAWPELLNKEWMGKMEFFKKWGKASLRVRIVCHVGDLKDGGSLLEEIKQWFPKGRYTLEKNGVTYVSQIRCDSGLVFSVRTFDQSVQAHAGPNLDLILVNEPMPMHLHAENIGRLRNSDLKMMIYFLTPLGVSAWMYDQLIEGEDGVNTMIVNASIWDNCKDIPGTNGVLSRDTIEQLKREWNMMDPDEAHAREFGEFKHLSGRIYKVFNEAVHVIEDFEIPDDWNLYRILDPHDVRSPAVTYWAVSPLNTMYCIAEYPNVGDYTKMGPTQLTYDHFVQEMKEMEGKKHLHGRDFFDFIDPNKGPVRTRGTNLSIMQEYNARGFEFVPAANDDLDFGHKRIQQMLYFDVTKEVSEFNKPKMYFFASVRNTISAMRKYSWKSDTKGSATQRVDQAYKDFADCVRYFGVSVQPWSPKSSASSITNAIRSKRRGKQ